MIEVNEERLKHTLTTINSIGRDAQLGEGLHRTALSAYDCQGRAYIKQLMADAGLQVVTDGALNIHGRLNWPADLLKPSPACPAIATGSHCDTVPGGGDLDGTLGVLAGIEALTRLKESGVALKFPVEVIDFTDEEGRFGGMLGSMSLAGRLTAQRIQSLASADGAFVADKLREHQVDAEAAASAAYEPRSLHAYVELHIEQGPVLDNTNEQLGVVTGIVGLWKAEFTFTGQANHAGTTPMTMRSDAFAGCADLRVELDALLARFGSSDSVGIIGSVDVRPGAANIVPSRCSCVLEVRDPSDAALQRLAANVRRAAESIAVRRRLAVQVRVMSDMACMRCDEGLMQCVERAIEDCCVTATSSRSSVGDNGVCGGGGGGAGGGGCDGTAAVRYRRMPSGAAHDAQHMPALGPTAMIFVPSIAGVSHHHTEATRWEDIVRGANVLLRTLQLLATGEAVPHAAPALPPAPPAAAEVTSISSGSSSSSSMCLSYHALLCIDLQSMPPTSVRSDVDFTPQELAAYHRIMDATTLPNVAAVLRCFRRRGLEVLHTRIQSLTRDGRDRSALHKCMGVHAAPGDAASCFLRGAEPVGDEIVLTKTASNAFVSTNIHYVLTNLGVKRLTVLGTLTDECVATTAKAAADVGYEVTVVADACAAGTLQRHDAAINTLRRYATVMDTKSFLAAVEAAAVDDGSSC